MLLPVIKTSTDVPVITLTTATYAASADAFMCGAAVLWQHHFQHGRCSGEWNHINEEQKHDLLSSSEWNRRAVTNDCLHCVWYFNSKLFKNGRKLVQKKSPTETFPSPRWLPHMFIQSLVFVEAPVRKFWPVIKPTEIDIVPLYDLPEQFRLSTIGKFGLFFVFQCLGFVSWQHAATATARTRFACDDKKRVTFSVKWLCQGRVSFFFLILQKFSTNNI